MKKLVSFVAALAMATALSVGAPVTDADAAARLCWSTSNGMQCESLSGTCESNNADEGMHNDSGGSWSCWNSGPSSTPADAPQN